MSSNMIRGLVLLANVALLGLVGWVVYGTFVTLDRERYQVEPPKAERFLVPETPIDESQQKKELYKAITRVFDRPPPPPPPAATAPTAQPDRIDPSELQVVAMNIPLRDDEVGSACLTGAHASGQPSERPRFFAVGASIDQPGLGFEAYKGCKVKAVGPSEVVIVDAKGKEVKLPAPK